MTRASVFVLALLLLSGCAEAPAPAPVAEDSAPKACADYLDLPDSDRRGIANDRIAGPGSIAVQYSNSGTAELTKLERLDAACAEGGPDLELRLALVAVSRVDGLEPVCADLLVLDPSVQQLWAEGFIYGPGGGNEWDAGGADADGWGRALAISCDLDPTQSLAEAVRELGAIQHLEPERYAALMGTTPPATPQLAASSTMSWTTKSAAGHPVSSVMTFSTLISSETAHAFQPSFSVGTACDFDPSTDVVISAQIVATNTDTAYTGRIASRFQMVGHKGLPMIVEGYYSTGATCVQDTFAGFSSVVDVAPGQSATFNFFFILPGYLSELDRDGAPATLAGYSMTGVGEDNSSILMSSDAVLLNGSPSYP